MDITPEKIEKKDDRQTVVIKTGIDAYVSELIQGGPQNLDDIKVHDYTPDTERHRMTLPKALEKKYSQKYAFRWVNKKKEWIDRAVSVRRWVICNRALFRDMPNHIFSANGTIENGDTILCFMPMENAERLRREPGKISAERVKELPMEKWKNKGEDSPFYKPTLGQEEKDGEVLAAGIQPDIQTT